nr:SOS response-associated peptidase family protein [Ruminococcus flavefaciens]
MIQPKDRHTTMLAGLYRFEERNGLQVPVFSVLTRDAIGELRGIHNRMPLILWREGVESWIKPDGNPQEVSRRALTEMCFEKVV